MSVWPRFLLCSVLLALATACSTSHRVPDDRDWPDVNAGLAQGPVRITMVSGERLRGSGVQVALDSTSWLDRETGHFRQVATASIASIERIDRRRGALQGAKLGAVLEGIAGSLVAGFIMEPPMDEPEEAVQFRLYGSVLGGVAGGLLGMMHGGLIGRAVGQRTVYDFRPDERPGTKSGRELERGSEQVRRVEPSGDVKTR